MVDSWLDFCMTLISMPMVNIHICTQWAWSLLLFWNDNVPIVLKHEFRASQHWKFVHDYLWEFPGLPIHPCNPIFHLQGFINSEQTNLMIEWACAPHHHAYMMRDQLSMITMRNQSCLPMSRSHINLMKHEEFAQPSRSNTHFMKR